MTSTLTMRPKWKWHIFKMNKIIEMSFLHAFKFCQRNTKNQKSKRKWYAIWMIKRRILTFLVISLWSETIDMMESIYIEKNAINSQGILTIWLVKSNKIPMRKVSIILKSKYRKKKRIKKWLSDILTRLKCQSMPSEAHHSVWW